jgi:hypothetical protein
LITGWLSGDDCPHCGGPLLDTSTSDRLLVLECPGCAYRSVWHTTPGPGTHPDTDHPATPGDREAE